MKRYIKGFTMMFLIFLWIVFLTGCDSGTYIVKDVVMDKAEITAGDEGLVKVTVAKSSGRQQVEHTDVIHVTLETVDGNFEITPVLSDLEEAYGDNGLKIVLKPGAVLPREFRFKIKSAPSNEPGRYKLKAAVFYKNSSDEKEVEFTVK
jgi:hypothetical protein